LFSTNILILVSAELAFAEDEDYGYGRFSVAYAYVSGWYDPSEPIIYYNCHHEAGYWVDPNYPYGGYLRVTVYPGEGNTGYPAYTYTTVYLYDAFGNEFKDSQARAMLP